MLELLSPAGDFEKLKTAFLFGADSAYLGISNFSLRNTGITITEYKKCLNYARLRNKKIYLAFNIFPFDKDLKPISNIFKKIQNYQPDAIIMSDIGLIKLAKEFLTCPIHLSTQANTTNSYAIKAWQELGIKRIVLARELSYKQIKTIRKNCPDIELEIFVHGSMCVGFAGRCFLSDFLTNRSANLGLCTQPCRWEYELTVKGDNRKIEAIETNKNTYLMNSKDLCLIEYLKEIFDLKIDAIKIEGRMKPAFYTALTTKCYREAIDFIAINKNKADIKKALKKFQNIIAKSSHRVYTDAFFTGREQNKQEQKSSNYIKDYTFVATIQKYQNGNLFLEVRNKISKGDVLEVLDYQQSILTKKSFIAKSIIDQNSDKELENAHNGFKVIIPCKTKFSKDSIIIKKTS